MNDYYEIMRDIENASEDAVLRVVLTVFAVFFILSFIWTVARYVMRSLSIYTVAKRRQIPNYGLAWVPVAYVWTLGSVADQYDQSHGISRRWRVAMLVLAIVSVASLVAFWLYYILGLIIPMIEDAASMSSQIDEPAYILGHILPMYGFMIPMYMASGALGVCSYICVYKFYESCKPQKALKLLLLALLVPFAAPFCLLSCRKWDNGVMPQPVQQIADAPTAHGQDEDSNIPDL